MIDKNSTHFRRNQGLATWLLILGATLAGLASAGELSIDGPPALESLLANGEGGWVARARENLGQVDPGSLVMVSYLFQLPYGADEAPHVLTVAIPEGLEYQPGTAAGPGSQALVSFDGGLSFAADGQTPGQQGSPFTDVGATHLRWVFSTSLQPGVRGYVRYRAVKLAPGSQSIAAPVVADDGQEN